MLPILLALSAALSWGAAAMFVRLALRDMSTATGTLISLAGGLVFTAVLVAIFQLDEALNVSAEAVLLFAIVGIFNFPLGRYLNYLSMSHIGVGRSTPILASSPLFAMALAILFTGESLSLASLGGTLLIMAGLYVTLSSPSRAASVNAND
jgi:drug/metabolite transporter (DMT)-like permease